MRLRLIGPTGARSVVVVRFDPVQSMKTPTQSDECPQFMKPRLDS